MASEALKHIPEIVELKKAIKAPNGKTFTFKTKTRWNWVKPTGVPVHEGYHAAAAPEDVTGMSRIPSGGALGMTYYRGKFNPAMAAAPAAFGCGGCGGDHEATLFHGYDWESSKGSGRAAVSGREQLAWLFASALEEDGTLSGADVSEVHEIFLYGEEIEVTITDKSGKEETRMVGRRHKGESFSFPKDLISMAELAGEEPANDNKETKLPKAA